MSVSPDSGNGDRMSYLRFEDQTDGVHVFFEDGTFNDEYIATLDRGSAHTIKFSIDFKVGANNDVVNVYIDGQLKKTGKTWEDYYWYDPEQAGNGNVVPSVRKLLFRESGTAHSANAGKGFLIDGVTLSSAPLCMPTGFSRDGHDLTASQIGGNVTGTLNATGCDIGVYYGPETTGSVINRATIANAKYFGVVNDGGSVDVKDSTISNIGNAPFDGSQHGVGILYTTEHVVGTSTGIALGTISGNTLPSYQKGGITVRGDHASATIQNNTLTGSGMVGYIAQNGIQVSYGASATVKGNTVSGNWYTPTTNTACGLLLYQAGGVKQQANNLFGNEMNLCNVGRGGGNTNP